MNIKHLYDDASPSPVSVKMYITLDDRIAIHAMFKYHAMEICEDSPGAVLDAGDRVFDALLKGVQAELERLRNENQR